MTTVKPLILVAGFDGAKHTRALFDSELRERSSLDLADDERITHVAIPIAAPSGYFMRDHVIDDETIDKLRALTPRTPTQITATLDEIEKLRANYPDATLVGISDSAFHATKPNYAWNYGIDIHDADTLDIKRFGYRGLSIGASIDALWSAGKLPPKVVVCHLADDSSVTAVFHGRSIDTTTGFSSSEGIIAATRSGTVDIVAARALQDELGFDDEQFESYLATKSGLLGLTKSSDIDELLTREADGDHMAHLGLTTLIHGIHKAIGSMIVAMNGCDLIVFTGTIGARSSILRRRIMAHLQFMDFVLDGELNDATTAPDKPTFINQAAKSRPIVVVPALEAKQIAKRTLKVVA